MIGKIFSTEKTDKQKKPKINYKSTKRGSQKKL